jgi:hypothetical protein
MRQSALLFAAAAAFVAAVPTLSSALPAMDQGIVAAQSVAAPGIQKAYYPGAYGYYRPYAYYSYYRPYVYYGYAQPYASYSYYPYSGYYVQQGCYTGACGYYGYSGW